MRTTYIVTLETRDTTEPDSIDEHDVADSLRSSYGEGVLESVTAVRLERGSDSEAYVAAVAGGSGVAGTA